MSDYWHMDGSGGSAPRRRARRYIFRHGGPRPWWMMAILWCGAPGVLVVAASSFVGPHLTFGGKTVGVSNGVPPVPAMVLPEPDDDGTIFISIASYRDGERCGQTLQSIFETAHDPDKIIVGLVEQNDPSDIFCLEQYCKAYNNGLETIKRHAVRKDMTKVMANQDERIKCPRYNQVRLVAFHDLQAKGPNYSRSLVHHVLGNEEYCLQMDAHSKLAPDWDLHMKQEWMSIGNEFAVLSTIPPSINDMTDMLPTGARGTEVPRQCKIIHKDNGVPDYDAITEKSFAVDLEKPLLSHGWSAAFSFSKCHIHEAVPYDPFSQWAMPIEQFVRYARMWTRGYDTYTPTRNYLFHDYGKQENGHGNNEWFNRQKPRFRLSSIRRARKILHSLEEVLPESNLANLGLYGLGKRRSLQQLQLFTRVNFKLRSDNSGPDMICMHNDYVTYDTSISPMANLYDEPSNLDAQPEYPLRTKLKFATDAHVNNNPGSLLDQPALVADVPQPSTVRRSPLARLPSTWLLFLLWVFGLVIWCLLFLDFIPPSTRKYPTNGTKPRRRKSLPGTIRKQRPRSRTRPGRPWLGSWGIVFIAICGNNNNFFGRGHGRVVAANTANYSPYQYDMTAPLFTPDGRLLQTEYATKAVDNNANPLLLIPMEQREHGNEDDGGTVDLHALVAFVPRQSLWQRILLWPATNNPVGQSQTMWTALSSVLPDGLALVQKLRKNIQSAYPLTLTVQDVAQMAATLCHQHRGGIRPYGARLVLGDASQRPPVVYITDPSGALGTVPVSSSDTSSVIVLEGDAGLHHSLSLLSSSHDIHKVLQTCLEHLRTKHPRVEYRIQVLLLDSRDREAGGGQVYSLSVEQADRLLSNAASSISSDKES